VCELAHEHDKVEIFALLRIVFRENYGYSNEYQSVDIRVLLDKHVQCINNYNVLAKAPETQNVEFVQMTMSRTTITYNQFYHC